MNYKNTYLQWKYLFKVSSKDTMLISIDIVLVCWWLLQGIYPISGVYIQQTFTCSKSAIEILEADVKYVQS